MKVLFAVNNENISESIIKKYQTMYKELISWKNVYYFNAIIKELQKDKSYDRIVIGEDLEPYTNNNYDVIDNFLFDKLDAISDEASNSTEGDIPIVLIATDRREKKNPILIKLFGIGIYNVLLGKDRSMENVCRLIAQPRTKKEAKIYYGIESDDVEYQSVNPDSVPEDEMNNIIRHYKRLGNDEEKYVTSFDDIASQYNQMQLRVIAAKLPLNVRAVLEEKSPKYQQVMIGSVKGKVKAEQQTNQVAVKDIKGSQNNRIGLINQQLQKEKLTKPVVIPSTVNLQNVEKVYKNVPKISNIPQTSKPVIERPKVTEPVQPVSQPIQNTTVQNIATPNTTTQNTTIPSESVIAEKLENIENVAEEPRRGRGRPKKELTPEQIAEMNKPKRGRGRPKKVDPNALVENEQEDFMLPQEPEETQESEEPVMLPQDPIAETPEVNNSSTFVETNNEEPIDLFGLSSEENTQANDNVLPGLEDTTEPSRNYNETEKTNYSAINRSSNNINNSQSYSNLSATNNNSINTNNGSNYNNLGTANSSLNYTDNTNNSSNYNNLNLVNNNNMNNNINENTTTDLYNTNKTTPSVSNLVVGNTKIVAFVGTSKNGTSFLVNNLGTLLSSKGIKTAILDLTENKNAYYIYNMNDDALRNKAYQCIENLRSGIADGIPAGKNLTVYTTLPGENLSLQDSQNILQTLVNNYSLVLLDCDFKTYTDYFANAQEIYLVQTYDILTIQPLTAFLNELQHKNVLDESKLRVVINKTLNLRKLTDRMVIGGISCYNDPATTYQNSLFNKDTIRYTTIPFEEQTYAKYLERLVDCEVTLNGYSRNFLMALEKLGNMVYPLIANNNAAPRNYNDYSKKQKPTNTQFNSNMNDTLNRMRKNF